MTCRATSSTSTCTGSTPTGQQLSYDAEGRLSSWQNQPTLPGKTVNYLYDGEGHRVAMLSTVSGTTTLTSYIGSIEEVQTTGSTTQTTTFYAVGSKRVAADVNGTFYYFGYDALGSQVAVLNATGSLVGAQLYGPYGASRYTTGTIPTSIGFTGQHSDSVTGLDYYVARYYDALVGVFLSVDSVQGNMQGMEPYTYVGGNPETWTDPTGHCIPWCIVLLAGVVGGAVGAVVTDLVTGQPVTWQSVGEGALAGGLIAGAGLLIAAIPAVAAVAAAITSVAPAEGAVGGLASVSGYLTMSAAKVGAGLIGGIGGGAISGAVTGAVTDFVNHFWPQSDPKQDEINAQATVIAQKNNQLSAQATVIAKLQKPTSTPTSRRPSTAKNTQVSPPKAHYYKNKSYAVYAAPEQSWTSKYVNSYNWQYNLWNTWTQVTRSPTQSAWITYQGERDTHYIRDIELNSEGY